MATFRHDAGLKLGFVGLIYLDVVLTFVALRLGFTELNPIMANLVANPWALVLVKGAVPVLIGWLIPGKLLLPSIGLAIAIVRLGHEGAPGRVARRSYPSLKSSAGRSPVARIYMVTAWTRGCLVSGTAPIFP